MAGSVVIAEFDEQGELQSFLSLVPAVFAEMVWARDKTSHLRKVWHAALDFLRQNVTQRGKQSLVTLVASDAVGAKLGSALEALGCERLNWTMYHKEF